MFGYLKRNTNKIVLLQVHMLTPDCKQLSCAVHFFQIVLQQLAYNMMVRIMSSQGGQRGSRVLISVVRTARILPYACLLGILLFIPPIAQASTLQSVESRTWGTRQRFFFFLAMTSKQNLWVIGIRRWLLGTLFWLAFLPQSPQIHRGIRVMTALLVPCPVCLAMSYTTIRITSIRIFLGWEWVTGTPSASSWMSPPLLKISTNILLLY